MSKVYLLLGGNRGDKRAVFDQATALLNKRVGVISSQSSVYETEPWGFESQDMFWNQVLELQVTISVQKVLELTQQIEYEMGRVRKSAQYVSRTIDIDILFYDDQIIDLPGLVIPHPRIQERKFVLVPLDEIIPDKLHPVLQKSIHHLLLACQDQLRVERVKDL